MQLKYVDTKEEIIAVNKKSKHIEPHLHNALEIVCITSGTLELGVGQELYHMKKGDIGFVFPDIIHHYQVLTPGVNKATYLIASPFTIGKFAEIMQTMAPEYPVIKAEKVEPEVYRVINAILETKQSDIIVAQAYLQIVLARCVGKLNLVEKSHVGSKDLIYQTVSYISANFKKKLSLEEMAKDLGVSKYVLSRLFSKTFHRNFNQYLNDARLNYACHRLENTSDSITNICLDSGFESQRTFNRVFKERYKISPSDYRSTCLKDMLLNSVELTASSLYLTTCRSMCRLSGRISHVPSVKFKPICIMDDTIHAGIRISVVLKQFIPAGYRDLRNHHCRMAAVSAVDDFKEVAAFINVQLHQSKVIYNKQIKSCQLLCIV